MKTMPGALALTAAVLVLSIATAAAAAPLIGSALRATIPGSEFRGMANTLRGYENHIWRFARDGRVEAVFNIRRDVNTLGGGGFQFDGSASGTWSIRDDQLCIGWEPNFYMESDCYRVVIDERVAISNGHYVRLIGRSSWEGTLQR